MKQRYTSTSQSGDNATRNSSHTPAKKRAGPVLRQLVVGYLLMGGGVALLVLGLTVVKGPLAATVLVLLGGTLALVGTMIAILGYAQLIFGGIVNATEEAVARMQKNQPPPPPSSTP